jgi:hypothetical protein
MAVDKELKIKFSSLSKGFVARLCYGGGQKKSKTCPS